MGDRAERRYLSVEPVPGAALQSMFQLKTGFLAELERLIR
jgi:hypothetical protein